ncbi:hypothetical protein E2C01_047443 [Portunus trituberculatus]|uniref:Uncharacterized protein n=1 Tax=Portunus trituberculatus TaxID=210409 RepID=A0A5B7G7H1_PORTR|nr:hypothetical protein [Portunus trituberculatus]
MQIGKLYMMMNPFTSMSDEEFTDRLCSKRIPPITSLEESKMTLWQQQIPGCPVPPYLLFPIAMAIGNHL